MVPTPASEWIEALPIGNGRWRGMVFGGISEERIQVNEKSLWSGDPTDFDNSEALPFIPIVVEEIILEQDKIYTYNRKDCKIFSFSSVESST